MTFWSVDATSFLLYLIAAAPGTAGSTGFSPLGWVVLLVCGILMKVLAMTLAVVSRRGLPADKQIIRLPGRTVLCDTLLMLMFAGIYSDNDDKNLKRMSAVVFAISMSVLLTQ